MLLLCRFLLLDNLSLFFFLFVVVSLLFSRCCCCWWCCYCCLMKKETISSFRCYFCCCWLSRSQRRRHTQQLSFEDRNSKISFYRVLRCASFRWENTIMRFLVACAWFFCFCFCFFLFSSFFEFVHSLRKVTVLNAQPKKNFGEEKISKYVCSSRNPLYD